MLTIVGLYKKFTWPFGPTSKAIVYNVAIFQITNYIFAPFNLLDWDKSILFYHHMNYFGHIFLTALMLVLWLLPNKSRA